MSGAGLGIGVFRAYTRRAALRRVNNKQIAPIQRWNIVIGDKVAVLTGRHRGLTGTVKQVLRKKNRVVLAGVNVRRRVFRSPTSNIAQLKAVESPLHYSKVNLVDPASGKPTRVAIRYTEDGSKVRVAKRSGSIIPWPEAMKTAHRSLKPAQPGPKDTAAAAVQRVTYSPPPELLPYLSAGSGKLWSIRSASGSGGSGSSSGEAVVPWKVREVKMRRHDRNRMLGKWRREEDRRAVGREVARLLEKDPALQGVFGLSASATAPAPAGARGEAGGGAREGAQMR